MRDAGTRSAWTRPGRMIPLLAVVLLLASIIGFRWAGKSGVNRQVEEIRKRGFPTSPIELDAYYKTVPAAENAALAYTEAYLNFVAPKKGKNPNELPWRDLIPGKPLPEDVAEMVAAHLDANRATLKAIHAAALLPKSRYPIDLTKGPDTLLPHLAQVKGMLQLTKWEAIQHSENGAASKAVESLKSGFALARSLRNEPLYISELVRIACVAILIRPMEMVVSKHQLAESELIELEKELLAAEEDGRQGIVRAIAGERAGGTAVFDMTYSEFERVSGMPPTDSVPGVLKVLLFEFRRSLGIRDQDLAFYLQHMSAIEAATRKDYPEMLKEFESADRSLMKELGKHPIRYLISGMTLPWLSKGGSKETELTALLRCARMAIAIERYRGRNGGELPSAEQLVPAFLPEFPKDPVDGKALSYKTMEKGYQIVSLAATAERNKNRSSTNRMDIAFSVFR